MRCPLLIELFPNIFIYFILPIVQMSQGMTSLHWKSSSSRNVSYPPSMPFPSLTTALNYEILRLGADASEI